jgi:hypothetical protein
MKIYTNRFLLVALFLLAGPLLYAQPESTTEHYRAPKAAVAPVIDGIADDAAWNDAAWVPIENVYIGPPVTPEDFSGRYKVVWTESRLYLLAEITDDVLRDVNSPATSNYWDDDCLELFLDEDKSGGYHEFSYNAFAYHMAINNIDVIDNGTSGPLLFNDHITSAKTQSGTTYTWEVEVKVFADDFVYGQENTPVTLTEGKILGYNLAYCDNDYLQTRENFIGSRYLDRSIANNGYINADVFATLELVAGAVTTSIGGQPKGVFSVFPNPAEGNLLYLTQPSNVEIFDAQGNAVLSSKAVSVVDIASLTKGFYILKTDAGHVRSFAKQ